jgi:hypothetical protein
MGRGYLYTRGILLGLIPLFILIIWLIARYLLGYQCGDGLSMLLQLVFIVFWSVELLLGISGLFSNRFRPLAIRLILTLLISTLLLWPIVQLSFWLSSSGLPPLCHVTG